MIAAADLPESGPTVIRPAPGPQERFLAWGGWEALYGGAAGGGKSWALLIDALYDVSRPDYRAILFRRTFRDLERSLVDKSRALYPLLGAVYNTQAQTWTFPSGARVMFSHLEHESDIERHRSAEYQFVAFDELTTFEERQYRYLMSRLRSSTGIRCRVRAATNPATDHWVKRRFGPWVDREFPLRAASGETLWVAVDEDGRTERFHAQPVGDALSRTFIRATLDDNPALRNAATYRAALRSLDAVSRKQLLEGDWDAKASGGTLFRDEWFERIDPTTWETFRHAAAARVRGWDFGGTTHGDYSAGVLLAYYPKRSRPYVVEDVVRFKGRPADVHDAVMRCARTDGTAVTITIPQESGQSGVDQVRQYVRELTGWRVKARRTNIPGKNKVVRATPLSTQVEHGMVALARARWNDAFVGECVEFPDGKYDDQIDAAADALAEISGVRPPVSEQDFALDVLRRDERIGRRSAYDEEDDEGGFGRRE